jgi:hypothetical protein
VMHADCREPALQYRLNSKGLAKWRVSLGFVACQISDVKAQNGWTGRASAIP